MGDTILQHLKLTPFQSPLIGASVMTKFNISTQEGWLSNDNQFRRRDGDSRRGRDDIGGTNHWIALAVNLGRFIRGYYEVVDILNLRLRSASVPVGHDVSEVSSVCA